MSSRFDNIQSRSIYVGASPNPDPALGDLGIDGNLGVGTPTPVSAISVYRGVGTNAYIEVSGNGNTLGSTSMVYGQDSGNNGYAWNRANAPVIFGTNNTERMRITSDGRLGIQTTSPGAQLQVGSYFQVESNANYMGMLGFNRNVNNGQILNTSYSAFQLQNYQGSLQIQIYNSSGVGVTQHTFLNNGNISFNGQLGINTTPIASLDNQGTLGTYRQKGLTTMVTDILYADGTNATRYEIARVAIDYNDWNETGIIEIELYEKYWSDGLKKRYLVSYGYSAQQQKFLVEMSGYGINNFQVSLGTPVTITGDIRYLPIYVDLRYYSRCIASVKSNRNLTTNTTPWVGEISFNNAPSMTYISDFSADSAVYAGNVLGGNTLFPSGNVGIGTTAPAYKLDVNGDVKVGSYLYMASEGSGAVLGDITTGNYLRFLVSNSEKMRITSGGNVGIGTTNPIHPLSVVGKIGGNIFSDSHLEFLSNGNTSLKANDDVYLGYAQSTVIKQSGNVGIGTTSPISYSNKTNLGIQGAWGGQLDIMVGSLSHAQFGTDNYISGLSARIQSADGIVFRTNGGTESMRIASGGNVGIGTGSPAARLHVVSPDLGFTTGNTSYNALFYSYTGNASFLEIKDVRTSNGSDWTSVGKRLQMRVDSTYMGYMQFNGNSNNYGISFGIGGTTTNPGNVDEAMRITNSGNVGIGTTNPLQKLDIAGNISLGSWTKPGSTYVGLRRADDGSFGGGGDSGLVIESYNHASPYAGDYSQRVHLRTHLYNGGSHNILTAYGFNIGIGITSPAEKLHVAGNVSVAASTGTKIGFNTTDSFSGYSTSIAHYGISYGWNTNPIALSGYYGIGFFSNGNERMRITSGGNVGIGTTSPGYKFHVIAPTLLGTSYPAAFQASNFYGNELLVRVSDGLVDLLATYETSAVNTDLSFTPTTSGGGQTEAMRIQASTGNVGIGTSSPSLKLDVYASASNIAYFRSNYSGNAKQLLLGSSGSGITFQAEEYLSSTASSLTLNPYGGNVVIGPYSAGSQILTVGGGITTYGNINIGNAGFSYPVYPLHISTFSNAPNIVGTNNSPVNMVVGHGYDPFFFSPANITAKIQFEYNASAGAFADDIVFATTPEVYSPGSGDTAEERMRVTSKGSVGIGTPAPNPSALLDVTSRRQGFLPPRMTNTEMNAISSPAAGLVVYDTTNNKLTVYNGSTWVPLH